jgi:hypothetical protein
MVAGQQAVQAGRTCPKSSEEVLHPLMQEWALRCTELKAMKEWLAARRLRDCARITSQIRLDRIVPAREYFAWSEAQ